MLFSSNASFNYKVIVVFFFALRNICCLVLWKKNLKIIKKNEAIEVKTFEVKVKLFGFLRAIMKLYRFSRGKNAKFYYKYSKKYHGLIEVFVKFGRPM